MWGKSDKSLSNVWLFVTPWTGFFVHGILQERILDWVAISFFNVGEGLQQFWTESPRQETVRNFNRDANKLRRYWLYSWNLMTTPKFSRLYEECVRAKSLQSRPTLCDPMDHSLPGSSVHGILQAKILEWVAMLSSRGSSWPRDWTLIFWVSSIGRRILYPWATGEAHTSIK